MAQPDLPQLPSSLRRLWGLEERPLGGGSRALTLERIVAAAIELADDEGLPSLSMARLAERLGSAPMSLYRHVENKDELLVFMIDAASRAEPPRAIAPDDGWREGLRAWAMDLMAIYRRHPWILRLPANRPPLEPGQLTWLEAGLRAQHGTPLTAGDRLLVTLTLLGYVRGQAALYLDLVKDGSGAELPYGQALSMLIDADRLPSLSAVVAAGVFDPMSSGAPEVTEDEPGFTFGLELILDGIDALISSCAGLVTDELETEESVADDHTG